MNLWLIFSFGKTLQNLKGLQDLLSPSKGLHKLTGPPQKDLTLKLTDKTILPELSFFDSFSGIICILYSFSLCNSKMLHSPIMHVENTLIIKQSRRYESLFRKGKFRYRTLYFESLVFKDRK